MMDSIKVLFLQLLWCIDSEHFYQGYSAFPSLLEKSYSGALMGYFHETIKNHANNVQYQDFNPVFCV